MTGIRAVVFDAYGTLLDVHGAMARHAHLLPPDWERISAEWRQKQLEYTWIRSLTGPAHHRDFWQITRDSLHYVAARNHVASPEVLDTLMQAYRRLPAYEDAEPALSALRGAGVRTAILSNGEPGMLAEAVETARLAPVLDAVLSVEDAAIFKPAPAVYALAERALDLPAASMGFVSSNAWDAQAAAAHGFRVFWCNRTGLPPEYGLDHAATPIRGLSELPRLVA